MLDAPSGPLVQVTDLKMHFPIYTGLFRKHTGDVKAVDGVSFSLDAGETLGIARQWRGMEHLHCHDDMLVFEAVDAADDGKKKKKK